MEGQIALLPCRSWGRLAGAGKLESPHRLPSAALSKWRGQRRSELTILLEAHARLGGAGRGRRYATEQLNFAFMVAVASQFQGFCRDLHVEAVRVMVGLLKPTANGPQPQALREALQRGITSKLALNQGNAQPEVIAQDFLRLGMDFWPEVARLAPRRVSLWRKRLRQLNTWRNAIVHSNFSFTHEQVAMLEGVIRPKLVHAKRSWSTCNSVARAADRAVADYVASLVGAPPW